MCCISLNFFFKYLFLLYFCLLFIIKKKQNTHVFYVLIKILFGLITFFFGFIFCFFFLYHFCYYCVYHILGFVAIINLLNYYECIYFIISLCLCGVKEKRKRKEMSCLKLIFFLANRPLLRSIMKETKDC